MHGIKSCPGTKDQHSMDLYPPKQKPRQPSLGTLYKEMGLWVAAVADVAASLPQTGSSAATEELFAYHQQGLTRLAVLLIDYTQQQRHPYNDVFRRSKGAQDAAKATIARARQCAKLFAGYCRKPRSYDPVNSNLELRYLLTQLTNLQGWLRPPVVDEDFTHWIGSRPIGADNRATPPRPRHFDAAEKADPSPPGPADKNESSPTAAEAPNPPVTLIPPAKLVDALPSVFKADELRILSYNLDINPDELGTGSISSMALELVRSAEMRSQYPALVAKVLELRPNLMSAAKSPPDHPVG